MSLFFSCNLVQVWGNFSGEALENLAAVHDIGLALRSEADLQAVEKWTDRCYCYNENIICQWYCIYCIVTFETC